MTEKTLYELARERMENLGFTESEMEFIFSDWPEGEDHYRWLLRAYKSEIKYWIDSEVVV